MALVNDRPARARTGRPTSPRFGLVEELRGAAALAVVLYHAYKGRHVPDLMATMPDWLKWLVTHGYLGVAVFFALSGFVVAHSMAEHDRTCSSILRFLGRRFLRLAPPYWFAIFATIVAMALSSRLVGGKELPPISVAQVFAHAFYLQDLLKYPEISPVFWTLCLEVQFYVTYALFLTMSRKSTAETAGNDRFSLVCVAAAIVSLLWPIGLVSSETWAGTFLPLWYCFLLGVLSYSSWRNPAFQPYYAIYVSAILFVGVVTKNEMAVTTSLTSLLLYYAATKQFLSTGIGWRPLLSLGAVSYSLYLTHNPITGAVFRIGYMLTGKSIATELVWWPLSVAACIVFASLVSDLIEKPSMRLAKRSRDLDLNSAGSGVIR